MKHNNINKSLFTLLTWFLLQAAGTFAFAESIEPANGSNGEQIPTATADKQVNERPNANKQAADSAYMEKAYDKAIAGYEQLLKAGVDVDVLYNLGNAYYRKNNLPRAILNYEKALKYEPSHKDARHNLEVCRSKLGVSENPPSEMFFITWFNDLTAYFSVDQWGTMAMLFFSLTTFLIVLRRMTRQRLPKKIASVIMPFAIAAFALAATNASLQYHRFHNDTYAVALQDSTIEDENGKAKKNILRAGTTVRLLKNGSEGKIMVQTSDKTCEGWANSGHFMPV